MLNYNTSLDLLIHLLNLKYHLSLLKQILAQSHVLLVEKSLIPPYFLFFLKIRGNVFILVSNAYFRLGLQRRVRIGPHRV